MNAAMLFSALVLLALVAALAVICFAYWRQDQKKTVYQPTMLSDADILEDSPAPPPTKAAALAPGDQASLPFAGARKTGRVVAIRGRRVILAVTHRSGRPGLVRRKLHEVSPAN